MALSLLTDVLGPPYRQPVRSNLSPIISRALSIMKQSALAFTSIEENNEISSD